MILETSLLVLFTASGAIVPPPGDTVVYEVAPVLSRGALTGLSVEIHFAGDADGETRLFLPREWAGSEELWRHLADLEVEGAASVREEGSAVRVITHTAAAPLTVRYRVQSAYDADPGFGYQKARPLIHPEWFFFHGEGVFATPEGRQGAAARFAWRNFPPEWKLASDLDHLAGSHSGTVKDVVESVAIGAPDLIVVRREMDAGPLRVAIRGSWRFTPEAFADAVERIIVAANDLWEDPARPFLVSMAPLGGTGAGLSYTGTARTDAFSVASTPAFELADATRFLAHEYLHTWFPGELGGHPTHDEALGFWFSEGFTDFYAARILVRAGVWTPADHVAELNRTLLRYATSPARGAGAADILQRFWTDRDVQQLPYDRGHLLAHLLEYRIREATGDATGLHTVLQAQRTRARRNEAAGERIPAAALFPTVLREEAGIEVAPYVARHVAGGEPIMLPPDLFGGCATVTTVTQPAFDRGFDLEATDRAGGILSGVRPTGPAYLAGMRDGMRIIRREAGTIGDSSVEIAYRVADAAGERVIRYRPEGRGTVTLQRVVLMPDRPVAECVQRMSGSSLAQDSPAR